MDIDTAFLNSTKDDCVYVRQPPGFVNPSHPDWVWKLHGGVYGLKQAPLLWNKHINKSLINLGFTRHEGEYGLYFRNTLDGILLVALYVVDLLVASPSARVMDVTKSKIKSLYSIKDLGPVSKFLGMNISQSSNGDISLSLADYISKAASTQGTPLHKQVHTPLSPSVNYFNDKSSPVEDITSYQSIVGQLIFISNSGRPDVAHSVSLLSRFLKDPRVVHLNAAHRVLQYLYTYRLRGLHYRTGSSLGLTVYSDASHGSLTDLPFSTGGYVTLLSGGCVIWSSKKIKTTICLSSTEAEYIAGSEAVKEIEWLSNLFKYMNLKFDQTKLFVDNEPAINLSKNPVYHPRTKHIDLKFHKMRHVVEQGTLTLDYVNTKDQLADIMTKVFPRDKFESLRNELVVELKH
ncbi:Tkp5 protein [Vanderwaltozyma polyspora DSM 70294]|uniref:Tkp5 protein n=1 Tax=Vanderwaltozyma polyspora (strain ATCC 22028 / DSM 70294 / BCRC 21397 / CBS 2163 / NBRC 10782 / NRRL Y-8283 / UCD 57-17) TaxID=436907 RepID=A7TSQ0_VANPO|nr:Tkp5 protein [Vanderwaltozyma polyspora DSM 70294]EDO14703.1 Tkp5 protein [Vanderwaltozyma polyspora DSM 70294]